LKKLWTALLIVSLILSLSSCGKGVENSPAQPSAQPPAETEEADTAAPMPADTGSQGITTDENLLTVDITLPASLFEDQDMTTFDPAAYAAEQGFKKAVLNEDGSVTVTMTRAKHKELLEVMTQTYEESFSEMIESESTPYIKAISHTESFGTITVDVDRAAYEAVFLDLTPFAVGMAGMMYQAFLEGEPHVEVVMRDAETGETIRTAVYPDDMG
jgi:hypothetical protein